MDLLISSPCLVIIFLFWAHWRQTTIGYGEGNAMPLGKAEGIEDRTILDLFRHKDRSGGWTRKVVTHPQIQVRF